jgi:hypothetical protein
MFKQNIIRFLKENKEYTKLLELCNKDKRTKQVSETILNSPYLFPITQFLSNKTPSIKKLHVNTYKIQEISNNTTIIIDPLYKENFNEIRKYLYDNGVVWRTYDDLLYSNITNMFERKKIALFLETNGLLSWSSNVEFINSSREKYKILELEEFYSYFEELKKKFKSNIKEIITYDNYKHYFR